MKNLISLFNKQIRVCIICEGNEEFLYLKKLESLETWNSQYHIHLINANGNGNIPARYQDSYQNEAGDIILIFCDTERKPYEQYKDIKRKINEFHGVSNAADEVIIFGNPCTMQIVLQHWEYITLKTANKKKNAPLIEKCTGISDYKAKKEQIEAMMNKITESNYKEMIKRVRTMETDDNITGSSNFSKLIEYLTSNDSSWIARINEILL